MVKGNPKASASSGTRKKHARKAAGEVATPIPKEKKPKTKEKGQGKNAKEPRVKAYIPPAKPTPIQPDPLDTTGLAHRLPPDLLIVLRSLGKKAEVTKLRALEDLQVNWVDKCSEGGDVDESLLYTLVDMLPVWIERPQSDGLCNSLKTLLSNPALWTTLSHAESCSFCPGVESFGFGQPPVRKAAWTTVQALLNLRDNKLTGFLDETTVLPLLSIAVLRSAFVEPDTIVQNVMWQPLLTFLREFPNAWTFDLRNAERGHDGAEDEDEEASDEEHDDNVDDGHLMPKGSRAYADFLQFLQLGCSGSPIQGYPTVVIVLSTIPLPVMAAGSSTPLADLCTSFWAAVDGRALSSLQRTAASAAFLSSLLECLVFLTKRVYGKPEEVAILIGTSDTESRAASQSDRFIEMVSAQFTKALGDVLDKTLKVQVNTAGQHLAHHLSSLRKINEDFFLSTWSTLSSFIIDHFESATTTESFSALLSILKALDANLGVPDISEPLVINIINRCMTICEYGLKNDTESLGDPFVALLAAIDMFGSRLWTEGQLATKLKYLVNDNVNTLVDRSPDVLSAYLAHVPEHEEGRSLWTAILASTASRTGAKDSTLVAGLQPWLQAATRGVLPNYLQDHATPLDDVYGDLLGEALESLDATPITRIVIDLFSTPVFFTNRENIVKHVATIVAFIVAEVDSILLKKDASLRPLWLPLQLLDAVKKSPYSSALREQDIVIALKPSLVMLVYVLPVCYESLDKNNITLAAGLLGGYLDGVSVASDTAKIRTLESLRRLFKDTQARPTSGAVLDVIEEGIPGVPIDFMQDILPSRAELDEQLELLHAEPAHRSLALVDPIVSDTDSEDAAALADAGLSYARIITTLLRYLRDKPAVVADNLWTLRHILALSIYASDLRDIPHIPSPVFSGLDSTGGVLARVVRECDDVLQSSLLGGAGDWRRKVIDAVQSGQSSSLAGLSAFVAESIVLSVKEETQRDARILSRVLTCVLQDVTADEVDLWIGLARKLEKTAPVTSLVLLRAVSGCNVESPRLERYRNEIAANITGVPPSKADTQGLSLLRRLIALAPDPESDIIFLPQPRAVSLVKACQQWATSDDADAGEEVECEMTEIFIHVAPILQNVSGTHWDFIMDVVENNLEVSSLDDASTLVTLGRTLRLVGVIEDLSSTNKALRAVWQERRHAVSRTLRDLAIPHLSRETPSVPRSICLKILLTLLQEIPDSLLDETTLGKICHLLDDDSYEVQKLAYGLTQKASRKRTEFLVIEAGVNADADLKVELPDELMFILRQELAYQDREQHASRVFTHLLGWMVMFDLFIDSVSV
ncbi:hypothetical protein ONZ45_g9999 [Pleurotus djamor]|nr:hypothetical protein ONZ45_g9999 [Pleurotus djamor]